MLRPHNRNVKRVEIFKKDSIVEPVVMDVVKMDDVGLDFPYLVYQLPGGQTRSKSIVVKQPMLSIMLIHLQFVAGMYQPAPAWLATATISQIGFPAQALSQLVNLFGYSTSATAIGRDVDLKKNWHKNVIC